MNSQKLTRVNPNGRIVIPARFRKALGIDIGDEVLLRMENNELRITTLKRRLARAQQLVRKHMRRGRSLSEELIAERRDTARHE